MKINIELTTAGVWALASLGMTIAAALAIVLLVTC